MYGSRIPEKFSEMLFTRRENVGLHIETGTCGQYHTHHVLLDADQYVLYKQDQNA